MFATAFASMLVGISLAGPPAVWHLDYARAHAEACSSDKPLFVVICSSSSEYAQMARMGVFLNENIEQTLRTDYVRFWLDTDTEEGRELAKQFTEDEDPHFVIIDRSGKWKVFYQTGYLLEEDLTPILSMFRRVKLDAQGRTIVDVSRRPAVQVCST